MGLRSKMLEWVTGWSGVDTPSTVTTTRAPAVLKIMLKKGIMNLAVGCRQGSNILPSLTLKVLVHVFSLTWCWLMVDWWSPMWTRPQPSRPPSASKHGPSTCTRPASSPHLLLLLLLLLIYALPALMNTY